ncbi:type II secretion system secretin GspD (plasmid) [Comamonas aquatica]|nr:type II secretion system secretin GspD [Comamonas aquatica]
MKTVNNSLRAIALASTLLCASFVHAQAQVELNFNEARIDAVATAVGTMVGKNVVVDPKVKGNLTLVSDTPVAPAQALSQFQAALRLHGFAMVDAGNIYKVVPEAEAKTHATRVNGPLGGGDVQTKVFTLNHENAAHMLNVVKPLVSPNNVVNIIPGSNSLVVTDYSDNLARIARLVASLDKTNEVSLEIIPLEHAIASEIVPLLQHLMTSGPELTPASREQVAAALQSSLIADNRSNSLIIRAANSAKLEQLRSLVARLDQPAVQKDASAGNLHVVHLKHADAVSLAETLRAAIKTIEMSAPVVVGGANMNAPTASAAPMPSPLPTNGVGAAAMQTSANAAGGSMASSAPIALGQTLMPSVGGQVQADPNTNSLIITASAPMYRQLRAVIDKLDSRRAQVLVESMIVEVSDDKLAEFGVQWQAGLGNKGSTMGAIGTNSSLNGGNILNIAAGIASGDKASMAGALSSLSGGLNLAVAPKILGQYYLGALANFLQKDGSTNIMSKPNVLTLDNQEARIVVGSNVPFVTGSYATTGGNSTVNPFTTVERKDVGLTLRIKPTINENGTVKLSVSQEASSVDPSSLKDPNGPRTSIRSVDSTVLVDDGSIVMLGGLMQDQYSNNVDKVPVLGDIPVVGNLFKSENRTRNKTNLMIFLRPVVMRDAASTQSFAMDRYQEIRSMQANTQPAPSIVMGNVQGAPMVIDYQNGAVQAVPAVDAAPVPTL